MRGPDILRRLAAVGVPLRIDVNGNAIKAAWARGWIEPENGLPPDILRDARWRITDAGRAALRDTDAGRRKRTSAGVAQQVVALRPVRDGSIPSCLSDTDRLDYRTLRRAGFRAAEALNSIGRADLLHMTLSPAHGRTA